MNGKTRARTAIRILSVCTAAHVRYACCNTSVPVFHAVSSSFLLLPFPAHAPSYSYVHSLNPVCLTDVSAAIRFSSYVPRNSFESYGKTVHNEGTHCGRDCCPTSDTYEHVKPLKYTDRGVKSFHVCRSRLSCLSPSRRLSTNHMFRLASTALGWSRLYSSGFGGIAWSGAPARTMTSVRSAKLCDRITTVTWFVRLLRSWKWYFCSALYFRIIMIVAGIIEIDGYLSSIIWGKYMLIISYGISAIILELQSKMLLCTTGGRIAVK